MTEPQAAKTLRDWQDSAPHWVAFSETIREMFAPLTRALVEEAGISAGQSILDLAGGAGEPALTIAEQVGPEGLVTCTDAIAEMIKAAERAARERKVTNVRFQQCAAEALPFPDNAFDVAVSRLGAMFFPESAFAEILRVTKPRGTIAFAVWGQSELNPFCYLVTNTMARHVESPPADLNAPGAFRFAEPGKLVAALRDAGAVKLHERLLTFEIAAPISSQEFWEMRSRTSESLRTKLATISAKERFQIAEEVDASVQEYFPNNEMRFPAQMLIVSGRKPAAV